MNALKLVWKEAIGMFVDDGSLALMAIALIAIVTVLVAGAEFSTVVAEAGLPLGLGLILVVSVHKARKRI